MLLEKGWLGLGEEVKSCCAAGLKKALKGVQGLGFLIHPLRKIQGLRFPRSAAPLLAPPQDSSSLSDAQKGTKEVT